MAKAKDPPKVMDVVHPGSSRPSPTSRPVINANRSYLKADPMLSTTKSADTKSEASATPSQTAGHVIEPPADLVEAEAAKNAGKEDAPSAPELKKVTITEEDAKLRAIDEPLEEPKPDAELEEKTEPESEKVPEPKPAEEAKPEPEPDKEPEPKAASKLPEPMPEKLATEKPEVEPAIEKEAESAKQPDEKPSDEPASDVGKSEDAEPTQDDKEIDVLGNTLPVEERAAKQKSEDTQRQKELEHLIESRKYALSIDASRHRRRVMLWSLLLIVVLALVAVDLLADLGTITLPFSLPHTNFFS